jgi:peptidyl-prolyl isomerase G (cyclophilin G)
MKSLTLGCYSLLPDFTKRNGTGGESIYGSAFPDEDLTRPLDSAGLVHRLNVSLMRAESHGTASFVWLIEDPTPTAPSSSSPCEIVPI